MFEPASGHPEKRVKIVQAFGPKANGKPEWAGSEREIDVLISTDVLSEGQNLQDCGFLLNYDLHWNPTRMVQRAGRIDRIGTDFNDLWIYNMFPDRGLDRLLNLVDSLSRKIADIDRLGMLDASVLGEEVHSQTFNTLKRISEEDNSVIEEEEQFTELASSEVLLQQLTRSLCSAKTSLRVKSAQISVQSVLPVRTIWSVRSRVCESEQSCSCPAWCHGSAAPWPHLLNC